MLTGWLTLTAVLAGSVITGRAAASRGLTFAPTCRVKSHLEVELTLKCGDGECAGVVQYWHTPFGELQTPGFHAKLNPVFMHDDGSLVIPNSSILHSGLYYCLQQNMGGMTLWQYELHVHPNNRNHSDKHEQSNSCAAVRFRRSAGLAEKTQAGVSDGLFAGAVVASVLLTFVVGFSAGALSRTPVLRCFEAITTRLQAPKRQPRQTDMPDHGSRVTMTTMPSTYNNQVFESEDGSANCATMELTTLTSPSPPAKPQRSFRHKREGEEEATAYLEGCDHVKKGEVAGEGVEEIKEVCDGEPKEKESEFNGAYLLEDEGNQTETDEDKHSEDKEVEDEKSTMDGNFEDEEATGEVESLSKEDGDEVRRDREKTSEEVKEEEICAELEQPSTETEDNEKSGKNEDATSNDITGESSSAPIRGRRSRVIRLYQYDEDGQRFGHLPDPTPEDQRPAPKLRQRSISLTRLSTIIAAASGPLDQKETDTTESDEERPQFHMEI